jgi:putative MATE family efflux protein
MPGVAAPRAGHPFATSWGAKPLTATAAVARPEEPAVFVTGSTMRHVAVMTATGAIGLIAIFAIDLLSLFWVSSLGDQAFKAAVGYASQVLFLAMAINIGLTIALSAVVSRALGRGDPDLARSLATSGLYITLALSLVVAVGLFFARDLLLGQALHASGRPLEIASRYLAITLPANIPMGLGMALSGVLRAAGDAKRAMFVTLFGGIATAFADPLFIFGLGLGVYGAAWATVVSRLVFVAVGLYGAAVVHKLLGRVTFTEVAANAPKIMAIGLPAILANLATPVSGIFVTRVWSDFGEATVAGGTIVDRITPLAFGVIFALTASVGPVIGQNLGAKLFGRVRQAVIDAMILSVGYSVFAWAVLVVLTPTIIRTFGATGESAAFVTTSLRYGTPLWIFLTCIFVGNAAFNNLGYPVLATLFNWGRATLGTIPFAMLGAAWGGLLGAILGLVAGTAIFGVGSVVVAMSITANLAKNADSG